MCISVYIKLYTRKTTLIVHIIINSLSAREKTRIYSKTSVYTE